MMLLISAYPLQTCENYSPYSPIWVALGCLVQHQYGLGCNKWWDLKFLALIFLQNSLTLNEALEYFLRLLSFHVIPSSLMYGLVIPIYIRRSYETLHICVGKAEHCLMEWWEKLLGSSPSVCMCGSLSSTNSMGRRGWSSQIHGKPSPIHWALWMGELKTSHPSVHAWLSSPAQDSLSSFALVPDSLQVQCRWRCARSMQSNCMAWFM